MASLYTHDHFNKFVYESLPEEAKRKIKPYREYYHFGSQGPDLFFFRLSSVKQGSNIGTYIHERSFLDFWRPVESYVLDTSAVSSYLIGVALHFLVDVTVHPTVNSFVSTDYSHIDIETELDRHYMLINGENPTAYRQWTLIPDVSLSYEIAKVYDHYEGIDEKVVKESVRDFRKIKRLLHSPSYLRERFLSFVMMKLKKKSYLGLIMKQKPLPRAKETNESIEKLIQQAILRAPGFIEELLSASKKEGEYPVECSYNFDGRKL